MLRWGAGCANLALINTRMSGLSFVNDQIPLGDRLIYPAVIYRYGSIGFVRIKDIRADRQGENLTDSPPHHL